MPVKAAMFRLTREVRFAVNAAEAAGHDRAGGGGATVAANGYAGVPALVGLGHYFALQVTLVGPLEPRSQYLVNIKRIDSAVRERAIPIVKAAVESGLGSGPALIIDLFEVLRRGWDDGVALDAARLSLTPFLSVGCNARELPMIRLSQKFEFSAAHRLHNPALSAAENQELFGKCNNPHGHGHNYEVEVTLLGAPDGNGVLIDVPRFESIVARTVVDRFDHRHLNVEVPEFRELIPSVENIAATIYRLLKPAFEPERARLVAVTVWETPKTCCEYSE